MIRLGRLVRFSVNPFLGEDSVGCNSYASKPAGEGLTIFLELAAELVGPVQPQTGLVVNVTEIDKVVRRFAVPVFAKEIRGRLGRGEHMPLRDVLQVLRLAHRHLADKFDVAMVDRLALKLNPFRKVTMDTKAPGMMYFSEKFEFAATHKLWNEAFTEQQNFAVFGKCANPTGHGHNYIVEVTICAPADGPTLRIGDFEQIVDSRLMELVDHKNLNLDVPEFQGRIATVENLAIFAWERLAGRFDPARLHSITVWESDRTYCSYYGPSEGEPAT